MMWQIVLSLVCVAFLGAILWEKRQGKLMQSASDRKLENVNCLFDAILTHIHAYVLVIDSDFKVLKNNYYDFNNSNLIDPKEAVALGLALSLDSFGIGVSYSLTTSNCFIFPFLIGIFQIIFLSLGSFLGKKINNISNLPDFICSIVSGILLILFGIFRLY